MMRSTTLCLALLLIATFTFAQTTEQAIDKVMIAKLQRYYNNNQPDSLYKNFDPIMKSGLDVAKTTTLFTQMHTQLGNLKQTTFVLYISGSAQYKADYQNDVLIISLSINNLKQINGLYFKRYQAPAAALTKPQPAEVKPVVAQAADSSIVETPMLLKTLAGTLSGTLSMPKDAPAKVPVVLIIGAAQTDRNGNSSQAVNMNADTYKHIAEDLGKAGIACVRYDRRGVGSSKTSAKETNSKFTDYVDDASALLLTLKDDKRFSKYVILGHGEGALLAMMTAYAEPVNGLISAEGPGVSADITLTEQMKNKPPAVQAEFKNILDSLKKGKKTDNVDPSLYYIARPSLQTYLMTWAQYDPIRVIKKMKAPILLLQGTTDLQVSVSNAEKLKKGHSESILKVIDGMNYVLKAAPADKEKNEATYIDPLLPVKPEFITAVTDFIKTLK